MAGDHISRFILQTNILKRPIPQKMKEVIIQNQVPSAVFFTDKKELRPRIFEQNLRNFHIRKNEKQKHIYFLQ